MINTLFSYLFIEQIPLRKCKYTFFPHKSICFALSVLLFGCSLGYATEMAVESKPREATSQVKEMSGLIFVDARLEVSQSAQINKWLELVEISTPSTPSSNHARLWVNAQGTKQALKIIFDDGTIVSIAGN